MKSIIKKAALVIASIHCLAYLFIGDYMLEQEVYSNFEAFNQRRLLNEYNLDVNEKFFFSSCGDDLFRDYDKLTKVVDETNPNKYDPIDNNDYYRWIQLLDYNHDFTDLYESETTDSADVTCILFSVCRTKEIPLVYSKLSQLETFSVYPADYHGMPYNEQMMGFEIHYVWLIFKWVKVKTYN